MGDRLKGRNIVVTGAGSGIGAGVAADLADNGANVVVADINVENGAKVADRISKAGGMAVAVPVDVSNRESIKKMIAETVEAFGSLDVMFNNAGIIQTASYLEITEADWKRLMDVNGLGVLMGTQEAAKQMIAQGGGGKIINTASIGAKQGYPQLLTIARANSRSRR
jgi:meso-butanediol dehydrogenase/(S,S)-butanediol dehydrogenase/diacetyl reductase